MFFVASPWPHFGTTPLWEACRTSSNKIGSFPTLPGLCSLSCHMSLTSGEIPVRTNSCSGRSLSSAVSLCLQSTVGLSSSLVPQDCAPPCHTRRMQGLLHGICCLPCACLLGWWVGREDGAVCNDDILLGSRLNVRG